MKVCSHCKIPLLAKYFSIDRGRPDGLQRICKKCQSIWMHKHSKNPRVRLQTFINHIKRIFGLEIEQYNAMRMYQNNCCAICGKPEIRRYKGVLARLSIDHDHKTGNIRALLCNRCNRTLGHVYDDVELLQKMIDYLKEYKGE